MPCSYMSSRVILEDGYHGEFKQVEQIYVRTCKFKRGKGVYQKEGISNTTLTS